MQMRPEFKPGNLRWALIPALAGSLAFVAVQSRPEAAVPRLQDLAQSPRWSSGSKAMAYESLGRFYRSRRDTAQAAEAYRTAWAFTPGNTRLARNAIGLLSRTGKVRQAANLYTRLVEHGPVDSMTWTRYGLTLWDAGAADSARWALEAALRVEPRNGVAARELARVLVTPPATAEDTARARALLERLPAKP
jgi:Tfp pilus assembly protein PilF